jgi:ATP adenylyltransferase
MRPDELDRLWTPHRMAYVSGSEMPAGGYANPASCPFCLSPDDDDVTKLIVARGERVFAILNLYPYNPGHLMLCPYRHVSDYAELDAAEAVELAAFTQLALRVIRSVSGAHGFNVGMNLGSVAGAGIAAHLHQHVVPRWGGDTNFMPVIGQTKVLPQLLSDTRELLAKAWEQEVEPARVRPDGTAPDSTAPDSMALDGTAPNPDGTALDGAAREPGATALDGTAAPARSSTRKAGTAKAGAAKAGAGRPTRKGVAAKKGSR